MKKQLIITLGLFLVGIAAMQSGIFDSLFLLLFMGVVPYSHLSVPPLAMLIFCGSAIVVLTHWVAVHQLYPGSPKTRLHSRRRKLSRKKTAASPAYRHSEA